MFMLKPLVSVIIPAFNAEKTIDATLMSARRQTYESLEIIIVDDGSTDGTALIAHRHAADDRRVRIISQPNAGLAASRNRGIAESQGAFVAPLDADDIWAPGKIAIQVVALEEAGPTAALAYNWFRLIDQQDNVMPASPYPHVDGHVFHRHLEWNFISNGSTPLIRKDIALQIPYDPTLRGCEDYYFQLQVARRYAFVCVPAFLTGYRRYPGSMSSKKEWMIHAHLAMYAKIAAEAGEAARGIIARRCATLHVELAQLRMKHGATLQASRELIRAARYDNRQTVRALAAELRRRADNVRGKPAERTELGQRFELFSVTERDGFWKTRRSAAYLAELELLDRNV
jgi:glycosyltransferase involved in cell wall biosynthesis